MAVVSRKKSLEKKLVNQQFIKETNMKLLFNLINKHGTISRAELAHITQLSPTTVSVLVDELLNSGIVISVGMGKTKTSGRKPIMLEINPQGAYIASFAWKKKGLKFSLMDLKCNEVENFFVNTTPGADYAEEIRKAVESSAISKLGKEKLLAVCIVLPAIVEAETKRIVSTVLDINEDNNVLVRLTEKFPDVPIVVGNESAFFAYAEKEFSDENDVKNLVYVNIHAGVGAGIVFNGQIFRGSSGMAGEFGHMSIDINGPKCACGNRGCLERLVSVPAMARKINESINSGRETVITQLTGNNPEKITIEVIKQALDMGDPLVLEIVDETASKLAFGISNIISIFNPEVVVLGVEIQKLGDVFLEKVKENTSRMGFRKLVDKVHIKYTDLGGNVENLGATKYFLDNIFKLSVNMGGNLIVC